MLCCFPFSRNILSHSFFVAFRVLFDPKNQCGFVFCFFCTVCCVRVTERLSRIFMKHLILNVSIAEACYETGEGGPVLPFFFFPNEQVSPPLLTLPCFILEKIFSA